MTLEIWYGEQLKNMRVGKYKHDNGENNGLFFSK
jgi:hypothetical protein